MLHSLCAEPGWQITFEDNFDGNQLNQSRWTVAHNRTHGDLERQLYLKDEVWVSDGNLVIRTRKNRAPSPNGTVYEFTSGWVESVGKVFQRYGRFEVNASLPPPQAGRVGKWPTAWPAAWLMPEPSTSTPPNVCWPVGGEIDIMEGFSHKRPGGGDGGATNDHAAAGTLNSIYMTYHWAHECGKDLYAGGNGWFPPRNDSSTLVGWTDYHTYAVEWSPTQVVWYVDGMPWHTRKAGEPTSLFIPQWPMYMILNSAVNSWADAQLDTGFPVYHRVDRVTFCQHAQGRSRSAAESRST